ncbi:ParB/RepB/Spo0J family partition protein [Bifidobacterium sp. ESL0775]|uniref:ParB/RepB/Spo0J family partition protein n=1 Tax=Bifidobacterium sp. ESL0775 TaxID=2983230 RepID=UPI0023F9C3CE|nr:ParB/RepB/Spo0J family partition protein [Bifidobacterium sp. ESL0775]WEV69432.1 ParB/RepB/Spo0J family partition protein [Bifidobacterium sp. ESL0775]
MASKSRLGKGLGALFPALPGEPVFADENSSEVAADESPKSTKNSNKKAAVKASSKNVSRETSPRSAKRRRMMPSLKEGMAHPSDLFFGSTVEDKSPSSEVVESKTAKENARSSAGEVRASDSSPKSNVEKDNPENKGSAGLKPVQGGYLVELKLDQIGPNANQPRTIFDEDELKELAASLKEVGVLQPVVVRKRPANQKAKQPATTAIGTSSKHLQQNMDSEYELIMGERRWRAAHLAGLDTIPAIVKTTTDDQMLRDALLENLHRVALNPLEESAAYQQMMEDFGLTQEQLSKSVSKSRSQIANTLRLLNLPPSVQKKVAAGVLSAGHARALLGLPNEEEMEKLANRIIAEGLSVRSTEEIVAMKSNGDGNAKKQKSRKDNPWAQSPIQHNLEDRFDTKVSIKGSKQRGRIEIVFSSSEDMKRIVGLLMPKQQNSQQNGWV